VNIPFVTVLIPTFNRKEALKGCLESLFIQTYPRDKFEIIVVNDGSTDGTENLLEEYEKKAPCKLKWYNQSNSGIGAARNLGIKKSVGEILCFIDDDCIADKNWIKNMVNCFSDNKIGGIGGKIVARKVETIAEKYAEEKRILNQEKFIASGVIITGNCAIEEV
jgi:glycosyltransferase involved in cell wall biosynthesis